MFILKVLTLRQNCADDLFTLPGGLGETVLATDVPTINDMRKPGFCQEKITCRFAILVLSVLLLLSPLCSAQVIRIRVINSNNGQPIAKQSVSVNLPYDKGQKAPPKHDVNLELETDANGEARFHLPEPAPAHLWVRLRLAYEHWHCDCAALITTEDVIQKGIVQTWARKSKPSATNAKTENGVILFQARPFTLLERILYPLLKE